MAEISVKVVGSSAGTSVCSVEVVDGTGRAEFTVEVDEVDRRRLAGGKLSPEELVRRSFEFLLKREPKESVLRRFNIKVISQYFPEYEEEVSSV
jgi:hypothetical protein